MEKMADWGLKIKALVLLRFVGWVVSVEVEGLFAVMDLHFFVGFGLLAASVRYFVNLSKRRSVVVIRLIVREKEEPESRVGGRSEAS